MIQVYHLCLEVDISDGGAQITSFYTYLQGSHSMCKILPIYCKILLCSLSKQTNKQYLLLFLNQLATISTDNHTLSREIYNALNFIYDHIESDISIDDLAKCSMLSVPQFKVRFKQEVGISPRSFINMQKIELAKQMLLEGSSKTQIALSLGFNTSSYFSAVFKRYTFCTPSEYVKKHCS